MAFNEYQFNRDRSVGTRLMLSPERGRPERILLSELGDLAYFLVDSTVPVNTTFELLGEPTKQQLRSLTQKIRWNEFALFRTQEEGIWIAVKGDFFSVANTVTGSVWEFSHFHHATLEDENDYLPSIDDIEYLKVRRERSQFILHRRGVTLYEFILDLPKSKYVMGKPQIGEIWRSFSQFLDDSPLLLEKWFSHDNEQTSEVFREFFTRIGIRLITKTWDELPETDLFNRANFIETTESQEQ